MPCCSRSSVRLEARRARLAQDLLSGAALRLALRSDRATARGKALGDRLVETQPIPRTPLSANKVHNLRVAAACLQDVAITPGALFSFWALVGRPTEDRA